MCSALKVTRQGYYAWRRRPPSAHDLRDAELAGEISEVYESSRRVYGAPKVHAELRRRGVRVSRERVARVMRESGRAGATRGRAERPEGGAEQAAPRADSAPGLARRGFGADGPSGARFADITYVRTHRGRPCLAVVMGIRSGKAVGWSMSARMAAEPAGDAPGTAVAGRGPPGGRIRHGDRGSRHVSLPIGRTMREAGIGPSTGSIAGPWDDAATESPMGPVEAGCAHARSRRGVGRHWGCSTAAGAPATGCGSTPRPATSAPRGSRRGMRGRPLRRRRGCQRNWGKFKPTARSRAKGIGKEGSGA